MTQLTALIKRNIKLYFKDKGLFFTSLITPIILLVLYSTFLSNVYESSFRGAIEAAGASVSDKLINGTVAGQLVSSLLAVCCVTVAFNSNMLMVQDKITGVRRDLVMSAVKNRTLAMGYFIANMISTLMVCGLAAAAGLVYMYFTGWFMSCADIMLLLLDVFLLSLFGSLLSSIINCFISSNGQMTAVGTIISAGYGFICGAYMPISQFSEGLQKTLSFLPGTYGTSLLRNHTLRGVFDEMKDSGFPDDVVEGIMDSIDCNVYFFDDKVSIPSMYIILGVSVAILLAVYIPLGFMLGKKAKK
ncbi:MAG: ABC transporter permease [Oscillospiraceae bacterium]|nr:ABC transporter permease [Oscillospiraceae bacterium]